MMCAQEAWEDQVATSPFLPLLKRTTETAPKNASFCSSISAFGIDFRIWPPLRASYLEAMPAQAVGKTLQTAQPGFTQVYQRRQRAFRAKLPTLPVPLTYALASPLYREVMVEAAAGLGLPPSEGAPIPHVPRPARDPAHSRVPSRAAQICSFFSSLRPVCASSGCAPTS